MNDFSYRLINYDEDVFGLVPPSRLMELAIDASVRASDGEGIPNARLMEALGGVWMLARMRFRQTRAVGVDREVLVNVGRRFIEGGIVVRTVTISEAGEPFAELDLAIAAVNAEKRIIIRADDVEPLWIVPSEKRKLHTVVRIPRCKEPQLIGDLTLRYSDCDANGHLAAPRYADVICELAGFWKNEPQMMHSMNIDYNSECGPGSLIELYGERAEGELRLRGQCAERTSFTASCRFSPVTD